MSAALAYDYRGARHLVFTSTLPGGLKLLLLALIEWMPHCEPSVTTLALQCGVERKTVLRALQRLEQGNILRVGRATGRRSRYELLPPEQWKALPTPVPPDGTGTALAPVPPSRTGTSESPVPAKPGTGTNEAPGPVPTEPETSPTVGLKAVKESRSESGSEAAHARMLAGAGFPIRAPSGPPPVPRAFTMPSEQPSESYLGACTMAGVAPKQARSTWSHYVGQGLPPDGVERLEWWLVQRAKEKQERAAKASPALPPRPGDDLDTTGAAIAWRPKKEHVDFAREHLKGHDLAQLATQCRAVPRFAGLGTLQQDREFLHRLRYLKTTGRFLADGPLTPPKGSP
jgi:hypothetical protein